MDSRFFIPSYSYTDIDFYFLSKSSADFLLECTRTEQITFLIFFCKLLRETFVFHWMGKKV